MVISDLELDKLILEIIADCTAITPPLDRNEISQHVVDHVSHDLRKHVYAALERMTRSGEIIVLEGEETRALRYSLATDPAPRH